MQKSLGRAHDIAGKQIELSDIYASDDYFVSQKFAKQLKTKGLAGIYYSNMRHLKGLYDAIFRPNLISKCRQERHLVYRWDGE